MDPRDEIIREIDPSYFRAVFFSIGNPVSDYINGEVLFTYETDYLLETFSCKILRNDHQMGIRGLPDYYNKFDFLTDEERAWLASEKTLDPRGQWDIESSFKLHEIEESIEERMRQNAKNFKQYYDQLLIEDKDEIRKFLGTGLEMTYSPPELLVYGEIPTNKAISVLVDVDGDSVEVKDRLL